MKTQSAQEADLSLVTPLTRHSSLNTRHLSLGSSLLTQPGRGAGFLRPHRAARQHDAAGRLLRIAAWVIWKLGLPMVAGPRRTKLIVFLICLAAAMLALPACNSEAPLPVATAVSIDASAAVLPSSTPEPTATVVAQAAESLSPTPADPVEAAVAHDPTDWPAAEARTIAVDVSRSYGPVSPWLFGTNYDPGMVVPVALLDAATDEMGIRFLRFPGGSYGDLNTVRPEQYDAFFKLAERLGAEPHIHVRYLDSSPEEAAETVRRINIEQGRGVRYWAIGNEAPYFYPTETASSYAARWRDFAEAMLSVDPSIRLAGPDFSQFGPAALAESRSDVAEAREWMHVFLAANGDLLDLVTFHRYPYPMNAGFATATIADLRPIAVEFDSSIPELRAMIRETTGRDIPIGLTEINVDSSRGAGGEATADSPFAAVWLADVLGRLMKMGVPVAAHYAFQTPVSRGAWGLLERTSVRPQYYVYQLYKQFGEELVYAASGVPDVSAYAALRDDGALTLLLINLGDEVAEQTLRLSGHPGGRARVARIDEANLVDLPAVPDGREDAATLEATDGSVISLPPRSATLLVWD